MVHFHFCVKSQLCLFSQTSLYRRDMAANAISILLFSSGSRDRLLDMGDPR